MDFLEKLALPQSGEHLTLLVYVSAITLLIILPYVGFFISSLSFAVAGLKLQSGKGEQDENYYKMVYDSLRNVKTGIGIPTILLAIPLISLAFSYAQLLQGSDAIVSIYLLLVLILFTGGVVTAFSFKNSFELREILNKESEPGDDNIKESYRYHKEKLNRDFFSKGITSLILFLVGSYILQGVVQYVSRPEDWSGASGIVSLLFSLETFIYFITFIVLSIGGFSAYLLYIADKRKQREKSSYNEFIKKISLSTGLILSIAAPVLVIIGLLSNSTAELSYGSFGAIVILLFLLLAASNLYYIMIKDNSAKYAGTVTTLFIIVFAFWIIHDQYAFSAATKEHKLKLAGNYVTYLENLKKDLGGAVVEVSGEDIYNRVCISCHRFDQKVVGPAYNNVLPKYQNNIQELADFIESPYKIDPDFPPMPDQGLKPNEAQAVAEYLMNTYTSGQE